MAPAFVVNCNILLIDTEKGKKKKEANLSEYENVIPICLIGAKFVILLCLFC